MTIHIYGDIAIVKIKKMKAVLHLLKWFSEQIETSDYVVPDVVQTICIPCHNRVTEGRRE